MPIGTFTRDWITAKALIAYRGATPFDPAKFRLCLADTNTLTRASTKADFITAELLPVNGYSRQPFFYMLDGVYNTTAERYELPPVDVSFTADGGLLQFQTAFLMANAHPAASRSFTSDNVDAVSDRITVPSHGLTDGVEVLLTAAPGATLPSGLVAGVLYRVADVGPIAFALTTSDGTAVDITDAGSGSFHMRYASGMVVCYSVESRAVQMLDGASHTYRLPLFESNLGVTSGV